MNMDRDKIDQLGDYYDTTDVAEHFNDATPQTDRANEVLVSTSIRLPQSLMSQVRAQAAELGIPATTLIRQWVTERAVTPATPAVVSVADLQRFIAEQAHPLAS
ncbi:MAG: CopG family antitoxin [Acidimicrobiales bacterium]